MTPSGQATSSQILRYQHGDATSTMISENDREGLGGDGTNPSL